MAERKRKMKFADINIAYTKTVNEWFSMGYTINAGTMNGSQTGEIAHIDLTDGRNIYRIVMEKFSDNADEFSQVEGIQIVAGRVTDNVKPNLDREVGATVWNNRIETMEIHKFYQITNWMSRDEPFYGTREEAVAASRKRSERYHNRNRWVGPVTVDNPKALEIAKRFITRKTGKSRISRDGIKVTKTGNHYDVTYFRKTYRMA